MPLLAEPARTRSKRAVLTQPELQRRWEGGSRKRSGPRLVLYFDREHYFFLCWKKCLVTLLVIIGRPECSCRWKPGLEFRKNWCF